MFFNYGFLLLYDEIIKNKVSEKTDSEQRKKNVNCIFNCKFFPTTTLEIWQLLLQKEKEKKKSCKDKCKNSSKADLKAGRIKSCPSPSYGSPFLLVVKWFD